MNGQFTSDGGTHQSAFREGILKGVNEFFKKNYSGVDVRDGISGAIAIKLKNPIFESQTKKFQPGECPPYRAPNAKPGSAYRKRSNSA